MGNVKHKSKEGSRMNLHHPPSEYSTHGQPNLIWNQPSTSIGLLDYFEIITRYNVIYSVFISVYVSIEDADYLKIQSQYNYHTLNIINMKYPLSVHISPLIIFKLVFESVFRWDLHIVFLDIYITVPLKSSVNL